MAAFIKVDAARLPKQLNINYESQSNLVIPGDTITTDDSFMRGHGTITEGTNVMATVTGTVETVNKLIRVNALNMRYVGEVGDLVVGRIVEVSGKRWKVDTNSRLLSVLMLTSVNLPGGELRRRSAEDELTMREYLKEGDLISAEVQTIHSDGALALHTRSLKDGKLGQGVFMKVSPSLIKRQKTHLHHLSCGSTIILGNNGYVWVGPTPSEDLGGFVLDTEQASSADRAAVCRLTNCIYALANNNVMLYDTSVMYAFEESGKWSVKELLLEDMQYSLVTDTLNRLEYET